MLMIMIMRQKPVGYHWQSLAINMYRVTQKKRNPILIILNTRVPFFLGHPVHCFYTIVHFAGDTVYVSLPHSFNLTRHTVYI